MNITKLTRHDLRVDANFTFKNYNNQIVFIESTYTGYKVTVIMPVAFNDIVENFKTLKQTKQYIKNNLRT